MTTQWAQTTGRIIYNPNRPDKKKVRAADDWHLILKVDNGISEYYRWWLQKRFGLYTNPPTWGCHVTVCDARQKPGNPAVWRAYEGDLITIEYSPVIYQAWKFWCLPVRSNELTFMQKELGYSPKSDLHITIGRML